jgi:hypothetical protein
MIVDLQELAERNRTATIEMGMQTLQLHGSSSELFKLERALELRRNAILIETDPKTLGSNEAIREATLRRMTDGICDTLHKQNLIVKADKALLTCKELALSELKMLLKIAELERMEVK